MATFIFCYKYTNEQFFMAHFLEIYISNEADWIVLIFRAKTSLQIATKSSLSILIVTKTRKQKLVGQK